MNPLLSCGCPAWRYLASTSVAVLLFCLLATGCAKSDSGTVAQGGSASVEFVAPDPLTMLVVGDDQVGPRIKRQWAARRDGEITVVDSSVEDFLSSDFEIPAEVDVLIYPPSMLGDLVSMERLLVVPREIWNGDELNKSELLKHYRTLVVRHDNRNWAVPLGSPCFSMICNRQLFKSAELEPPVMWDKMDRCLGKLQENLDEDKDSKLKAKVDLPLSPGWAGHAFLARVAPEIALRGRLSVVFERQTMKPLVTLPPFVESLKQMKAVASKRSLELDPEQVYRLAAAGDSAIAVTWPSIGFEDSTDDPPDEQELDENPIPVFASLPGSSRWFDSGSNTWAKRSGDEQTQTGTIGYGGLVGSVAASSSNDQTAWEFLSWLCSKKISLVTMAESPSVGPFRASHLGEVSRWAGNRISVDVADEFADVVAANHNRAQGIIFPRVPGHHEYFDVLDQAVRDCVGGEKTPEEALGEVSQKWEEMTEKRGRKDQIRHLKRATGL